MAANFCTTSLGQFLELHAGDLAGSFGTRLAYYPHVSKRIVLFDGYDHEASSAKTMTEQEGISQRSPSSQFQEQESAQQHSMQLSPFTQYTNNKQGELCRYLFRGRFHPLQRMRVVVKIETDK